MILIFLLALVASGYSLPLDKNLESNSNGLSDNINVEIYNLEITVGELTENEKTFSGKVEIIFKINNTLPYLQLNAKGLTFDKSSVKLELLSSLETIPVTISTINANDIFTLTPNTKKLEISSYLLTISYTGILNDDMDGFYKSSYAVDGEKHFLASTQFESSAARKAFPCFDAPQFKAQFKVTITCPNKYTTVISNAKELSRRVHPDNNNLIIVEFENTPRMSTYLLAFVISDFSCKKNGTYSVCSSDKTAELRDLALDTAPQVLEVMKNYTNFDYSTEMKHLQQVAIPDFSAGAMENWGLVTYREVDILWNEEDFSQNTKQKVVTVVTHELSHQWFGDLVTLEWWSDTFLNEGFATFFEYHAAHKIANYADMELDKQFVIEQVQTAFAIDTDKDNTLHKDVKTTEEIQQHFDSISYNKGGSILRMVESFLGSDNFKNGLSSYIDNRKEQNAEPSDLWGKLDEFSQNKLPESTTLAAVMENWITKAGYPIIHVNSDGTNITLTQTPFSKDVSGDITWYVPITYTTSAGNSQDVNWLTSKDDIKIELDNDIDWVIVNDKETGYYRVNYDEALLNKLFEALSDTTKSSKIDELNKAQIVDDLMNFASIGEKTYTEIFKFFGFLKNEDSYYPWYSAIRGFNDILKRIDDENVVQNLKTYILGLTTKLQTKNICNFTPDSTTTKTHIDILQKELVSKWISDLGDEACVKAANEEFARYLRENKKVNPNYRSAVYCSAIREDETKTNWNKLWDIYDGVSSAEQNVILKSLGCISDADILKDYLNQVITENSKVRTQDARTAFSAVQAGSKEGVSVVLDFINSNLTAISERLGEDELNGYISSAANYITSAEQQEKLKSILNVAGISDATKTAVTNANSRVEINLIKTENLESQFKEYFSASDANQNVIQYTTFISTIIVLMYQFL